MGLTSSASPLCSSSGRTGASRTSSTTAVWPAPRQPDLAVRRGDEVVGAQPVERRPRAGRRRDVAVSVCDVRRPRRRPSRACGVPVRYTWSVRSPERSRTVVGARSPDPPARRHRPQAACRIPASCAATGRPRRRSARRRPVGQARNPVSGGPTARCPAVPRRRRGRPAGSAGTRCWSSRRARRCRPARGRARAAPRPIVGVRDHLGQHRVVVAADHGAARTGRSRRARPGRAAPTRSSTVAAGRQEAAGRVLGVDPGLDRVPGHA